MTRRICAGLVLVLAGTLQACREVQSTDVSLVTDNFFHFDPDVSRDGRIAFAKPVEGAGAIFVMDSGRHKFSPDGKTVYYSGRRYDMLFYRRVVR